MIPVYFFLLPRILFCNSKIKLVMQSKNIHIVNNIIRMFQNAKKIILSSASAICVYSTTFTSRRNITLTETQKLRPHWLKYRTPAIAYITPGNT